MKESGENYLETILILQQRQGTVRSVDIAAELSYSKPSVSRAMGLLRSEGLITMQKDGVIHLTDKGMKKASSIYERHKIITTFLCAVLNVGEDASAADACRIEHVISDEVFQKIKQYVQNIQLK